MPPRTLTTSEARTALPTLVKQAARSKPGKGLRENAVTIQARGEPVAVLLVPETDIEAAERRIAELEEELEDVALMRMVEAMTLADTGERVSVDELAAELGVTLG